MAGGISFPVANRTANTGGDFHLPATSNPTLASLANQQRFILASGRTGKPAPVRRLG